MVAGLEARSTAGAYCIKKYQICSKKNGWHVEKNCIKDLADFGKHSQRGCPPLFYRKVFETFSKGGRYNIVYLDFSKAFDKVRTP